MAASVTLLAVATANRSFGREVEPAARGVEATIATILPIDAAADVRGSLPAAVSDGIDLGARQIVLAHPIIPAPTAAWPALLGVAWVACRVLRAAPRSSARRF